MCCGETPLELKELETNSAVMLAEQMIFHGYDGDALVSCTAEQYPPIRKALLLRADCWEKSGMVKIANKARREVARIDILFPDAARSI